ncbi:MAG: hypothetical protein WC792_00695 [Candidatus Micrarchaeia archaeon]|jgi:hypothetical protein
MELGKGWLGIEIAKAIAGLVCAAGLAVMAAWLLGIEALKFAPEGTVSAKFITALSFAMAGIVLFCLAEILENRRGLAQLALPVATSVMFLFMASILISTFFGVAGIENLFVKEDPRKAYAGLAGMPAVGTMAGFVVISAIGLLSTGGIRQARPFLAPLGALVALLGAVTLLGYALNSRLFLLEVQNVAPPMAILTAFLFVLLGAGLALLGRSATAMEEGEG